MRQRQDRGEQQLALHRVHRVVHVLERRDDQHRRHDGLRAQGNSGTAVAATRPFSVVTVPCASCPLRIACSSIGKSATSGDVWPLESAMRTWLRVNTSVRPPKRVDEAAQRAVQRRPVRDRGLSRLLSYAQPRRERVADDARVAARVGELLLHEAAAQRRHDVDPRHQHREGDDDDDEEREPVLDGAEHQVRGEARPAPYLD